MADAGGTILGYVKGSVALGNTFGTQIATPAIKRVRISTDTLARNIQTAESPELVSGYDVEDIRPVAEDVGGQGTAPLLWGDFDDWIEGLLFSTWPLPAPRRRGIPIAPARSRSATWCGRARSPMPATTS